MRFLFVCLFGGLGVVLTLQLIDHRRCSKFSTQKHCLSPGRGSTFPSPIFITDLVRVNSKLRQSASATRVMRGRLNKWKMLFCYGPNTTALVSCIY